MKRLLIAMAGLLLLGLPLTSLAGVSGTEHDMTSYGGSGSPIEELCGACHVPHGAYGDKLWSMDTTGFYLAGFSPLQVLCYTCHNDIIATEYDVFDLADGLYDHTLVGTDCSGDQACHDVHNQPVAGGHFLDQGYGPNSSGCENCHDADPHPSAPPANHVIAGNHPIGAAANGLICEDCHGAHSGVAHGDGTQNDYILLYDNDPTGGQWGQMCILCHNNQAPFVGLVTDVFDYNQTGGQVPAGNESKHPTYGGSYSMTGCNECHVVHATADHGYLLNGAHHDEATDLCLSCHSGGGTGAPGVGTNTHFTGDIAAWVSAGGDPGALPWAEGIDDDGVVGADWSSATTNLMVCETCHSTHRNGQLGYFTRILHTAQDELCTTSCHSGN